MSCWAACSGESRQNRNRLKQRALSTSTGEFAFCSVSRQDWRYRAASWAGFGWKSAFRPRGQKEGSLMYRVLIVDDEPILVDGMYRMLSEIEEPELELLRAYSGVEALERLNKLRVDLVISDIRMPGMSGLELHRRINERWPDCRVI